MRKKLHWLDDTFKLSIALKGIDGLLEIIGGVLLMLTSSETLNRLAGLLTQHELSQDPNDFFANHLLNATQNLGQHGSLFAVVYLISHGLIKIVLVINLLRRRLWAYPAAIGVFWVFVFYQIYRIGLNHSVGLSLLTVFDLFIIWLTYSEYQRIKHN